MVCGGGGGGGIGVGDLVLLLDGDTPGGLWPLAIVKEVNTGCDALVRSVRVKTRVTELARPITLPQSRNHAWTRLRLSCTQCHPRSVDSYVWHL